MGRIAKKLQKYNAGFNNPTGIYLNNLWNFPLITRGQENQQAILMRYALREMMDIALSDPETYLVFETLIEKLSDGTINYFDIILTNDNTSRANSKRQKKLISQIKKIISERNKVLILKRQIKHNPTDHEYKEIVTEFEDIALNLCHNIRFNNKWITDLLKSYKKRLFNSDQIEKIEEYQRWEDIYLEARESLIKANIRLVVSIAKKYIRYGIELADLVQDGNKGLIIAAENFDYTKGNRFITFAIWWIRQAILRSLSEKSRAIHLPANLVIRIAKINQFINDHINRKMEYPPISAIAERLGISEEKVMDAYRHMQGIISLDVEVNPDSDIHMEEMIKDTSAEDPSDVLSYVDLQKQMDVALSGFKEKEKLIMQMRFGLDDGREKTLGEIGEYVGLTNERVRQIILKCLKKLKGAQSSNYLLPWKDGL